MCHSWIAVDAVARPLFFFDRAVQDSVHSVDPLASSPLSTLHLSRNSVVAGPDSREEEDGAALARRLAF